MSVLTDTRLDVNPLSRHIGAEIRGLDLREQPDDQTSARSIAPGSNISSWCFPVKSCRRRISSA